MAISVNIKRTFLVILLLFFASGTGLLAIGLKFSAQRDSRRNAVVSDADITSLIAGGGVILGTAFIGLWGHLDPVRRKTSLLVFCCLVIGIILASIILGGSVWFTTLTMHDDFATRWRTIWSPSLRKAFQEARGDKFCCGWTGPEDSPSISDTCFANSTLGGCQDYVFSYADSYLRNIYSLIFGLVVFYVIGFLTGVVVIQARNQEARFERLAQKCYGTYPLHDAMVMSKMPGRYQH
ncbi:Tetraspanin/Peripherin [Piptocephalis cylindrospora]|uniref:Tetraspanin/Peripherin n=1 Tax=Piptocephalis cylindrospora TaxID=1907219 RepID=A0A4P9XZ92_9FUNG|nr:Tetraspanin/Peripherin [Piptocephalis cylindrospora]|eukprot:RKP11745.1 Tetraspanin/Peripherin [Piptocephalis cylindrospora]